ncbi:MAG TPA: multidrug ABC transporter permease [candidate division Zixibacteria bacterium]|jgi:putative ABC transport system permease protein|nr:multidrug ABC transporter permease [candidate division Zixibacteria bacterium]
MIIPLKYSLRSLVARRLTTALTVLGVMLVVFVFAAVLMLADGLRKTLVASGSDENAIVIRESSSTEIQSFVTRYQAGVIQTLSDIALDENDQALVTGECVVLISKIKIGTQKPANLMVRGIGPMSLAVHKGIKIIAGRTFELGKTEIIVGKKVSGTYEGCGLGQTITFGMTDWTIVGVFEADGASFESEIWGDVNQLMPAFGRPVFSSMTFRMKDPSRFTEIRDKITSDPRMTVDVKREKQYYDEQSAFTANFIKILGQIISTVFSLGAIIGAMITMYAAVANRTREIATMRALGFRRRNILGAFLLEALVISLVGGVLGLIAASFLQFLSVSTINWNTFSDLSFNFALSPQIIMNTLTFAVVMGFMGGFLPAVRASRIKIIEALRAE